MADELSGFISVLQVCSAPHVHCWVWAEQGARVCSGISRPHICNHPSRGDSHKSCVSPLIPYSLTFTVPVPPLPGCSSNTDAAIRLSPLISGYSGNGSRALSLASATQPCRSRAGFVHNWNVFQAYQSETEVSTGRKGVTLSGEGT